MTLKYPTTNLELHGNTGGDHFPFGGFISRKSINIVPKFMIFQ